MLFQQICYASLDLHYEVCLFYQARHGVFEPLVARNVGVDAADLDRRFDVEGYLVFVVRDPEREDRAVGERVALGGSELALELERAEAAHVADFLVLAPQVAVVETAYGVLEDHFERGGFADVEILGRG